MMITRLLKNEHGATAIEYALITALVVITAIAGIAAVGGTSSGSLGKTYATIATYLSK